MIERKVDEWGRTIFNGDDVVELLFLGHDVTQLLVTSTPEIEKYNKICIERDKASFMLSQPTIAENTPEEETQRRQTTWWIPEEYSNIDIRNDLLNMCYSQEEIDRVNTEMDMFEERELLPVLRLMRFLVDNWRERGIVWGVGRGSSVASYCLFLMGVHKINSLKYNLDITEFLK